MKPPQLILLGFKNAGKSTIGQELAKQMGRTFVDLDNEIIKRHKELTGEKLSCREIMKSQGEEYFREVERDVLEDVLLAKGLIVLALGGGTPMLEHNQQLLGDHTIVHITAPKSVIFERIMINGKPAFFPEGQDAFASFQQLWSEREPVFSRLATMTIQNTGTIDDAVKNILQKL